MNPSGAKRIWGAFLLAGHGGVKLCRPSEAFTQEDGEAVVAISGRRIAGGAS